MAYPKVVYGGDGLHVYNTAENTEYIAAVMQEEIVWLLGVR
jgi:hypothetical protein